MTLKIVPGFVRRYPFTIVMVIAVAAIGAATMTHLDRLQPALLRQFGFAPAHVPRGELLRLWTSAFLTAGGLLFYQSLAMLAVCVGLSEKRVGSWRTALVFWGVHLVTLVLESLVLAVPFQRLDAVWKKLPLAEHDVGPSAGYYGCLGLVCQKQPSKRGTWLYAIIGGVLIARLVWSALSPRAGSPLTADLAHLIAYPLGIVIGNRMRGRS